MANNYQCYSPARPSEHASSLSSDDIGTQSFEDALAAAEEDDPEPLDLS